MAFVTYGNTEGAKKMANDAITHLQTATKLKANLVDAYVVLRRCYFWQYLLDPKIGMAGWRESAAVLQKAKEFAPENPRVIFEEAIDWFYKPPPAGGDQQKDWHVFRMQCIVLSKCQNGMRLTRTGGTRRRTCISARPF
jgi:hypothetical protein